MPTPASAPHAPAPTALNYDSHDPPILMLVQPINTYVHCHRLFKRALIRWSLQGIWLAPLWSSWPAVFPYDCYSGYRHCLLSCLLSLAYSWLYLTHRLFLTLHLACQFLYLCLTFFIEYYIAHASSLIQCSSKQVNIGQKNSKKISFKTKNSHVLGCSNKWNEYMGGLSLYHKPVSTKENGWAIRTIWTKRLSC